MRVNRIAPSVLAAILTLGACTADDSAVPSDSGPTDLDSNEISLTSGLTTADDCDALLTRLIDEGTERVGPYGFGHGGYWLEGDVAMDDAEDAMEEAASDSNGLAGPSTTTANDSSGSDRQVGADGDEFSGTNNQERGVEEPDLVKTDGERLVVLTHNKLSVIDTRTNQPSLDTQIDLPQNSWASEMFLVGDRAYVMVQGWTDIGFGPASTSRHGGQTTTQLIEVDLESGRIGSSIEFEGSHLSAREIEGTIRFVVWSGMGNFPFVYPSNEAAEEGAEQANRAIIENSTIDDWLPSYRQLDADGEVVAEGRLIDCDRLHLPGDFSGFGSITVLTVDATVGLEPVDVLGVVTDGQTIYASTDRLTVATAQYPEWGPDGSPIDDDDYSTALHNFDITEPSRATYSGSGAVPGTLLSQYSLSEHDGYLRAATTDGMPWSGESTESMVTVLQEVDGALQQVGQVGGLGKDERIFAVRFMGDVAYVVTFRQIDPLYVIDLSEPTNPEVTGELKIPGFSTYLHPVGDDLLMGVGQDATNDGRTTGAQVSVFDVSDMTNPTRLTQLGLGQDSHSAVDWDPRAFLYWGSERLAFVPVSWWSWDETANSEQSGNAAVVVRVGENGELTEIGRISHPTNEECESDYWLEEEWEEELPEESEEAPSSSGSTDAEAGLVEETEAEPASSSFPYPDEDYCWSYQPEIRRTVIIGDLVYTVSDGGVQANQLSDLSKVAWLPLGYTD